MGLEQGQGNRRQVNKELGTDGSSCTSAATLMPLLLLLCVLRFEREDVAWKTMPNYLLQELGSARVSSDVLTEDGYAVCPARCPMVAVATAVREDAEGGPTSKEKRLRSPVPPEICHAVGCSHRFVVVTEENLNEKHFQQPKTLT